jgi:hypothetical protein
MGTIGKLAAGVIGLILLVSGAVVGAQHFKRQSEIKTKLEEAIGRDAGYTETILKVETDSSHITYGELFSLCDKSVEERTALIVELRGLYPSVNHTAKEKLIDFLNAENDTIRAKRDLYRRSMLLDNAMDATLEATKDIPSSVYGWEYSNARVTRAKEEAVDAAKELQGSAAGFVESYQKTLRLEAGVAEATSRFGIRFNPIFKTYSASNSAKGKEEGDAASSVIASWKL